MGEAHITLNGPYRHGANLVLGWVVCKFVASRRTRSSLWNVWVGFCGPLLHISLAARCRAAVTSLHICSRYWTCLSTLCSLVCKYKGGLKVGLNPYQTSNGVFCVLQCGQVLCANSMIGNREAQLSC